MAIKSTVTKATTLCLWLVRQQGTSHNRGKEEERREAVRQIREPIRHTHENIWEVFCDPWLTAEFSWLGTHITVFSQMKTSTNRLINLATSYCQQLHRLLSSLSRPLHNNNYHGILSQEDPTALPPPGSSTSSSVNNGSRFDPPKGRSSS